VTWPRVQVSRHHRAQGAGRPGGEGLLTRRQGAGTFVAARVEKSFSKLSSFSEDMISRGRKPESVWLSRSTGAGTPEESLTLGLSPGAVVYRFNRIRYADGSPMALEYSAVPGFCLPNESAVNESALRGPRQARRPPCASLATAARGAVHGRAGQAAGRGGRLSGAS